MTTVGDVLVEYKERPPAGHQLPVLTLTERNGFVLQSERFKKRLATEDTSTYKVVRANDIAFNPYLLWAGALAQNTVVPAGIISPLYPTFRLREGHDPSYIRRLLLSDDLVTRYDGIAFGSVPRRRRSSVADFLALSLPPLPPLDEQRRIAAILDQADALRAKRREQLALLDALPQAIFHEMFGSPVGKVQHHASKKLSDIGSLDRGVSRHRPRNDPTLLNGPYPLVQTGDIAQSGEFLTRASSSYSEAGVAQSRIWPAGTLCITIAANIAKTAILSFDACFPDSIVGFTSDQDTVRYVQVWFAFLQRTLEEGAPQSAQKNINLDVLRNLKIHLPPESDRREFAKRLDALAAIRRALAVDYERQGHLFASLQSQSFRGEL